MIKLGGRRELCANYYGIDGLQMITNAALEYCLSHPQASEWRLSNNIMDDHYALCVLPGTPSPFRLLCRGWGEPGNKVL